MTAPVRRYRFHIRRDHGGPIERLDVVAVDSGEALRQLPVCVSWDFALLDSGVFSEAVPEPSE